MKKVIIFASLLALLIIPSVFAATRYDDARVDCYGGEGGMVYFDGELPGCVDGFGIRIAVPNVDGILVTGPWLSWEN